MQLRYFVPFKAQEGVSADLALKEKLLNIEGIAIDSSVNSNKWQVPEEDLDVLSQSLLGAQLRMDHAESVLMVVGKVSKTSHVGNQVLFSAEVGDEKLIEKILRSYVTHVSIQVDSDDVECSVCKKPTRSEGMLIHLCPGAWEIVHKPKVRELSIVASPAYENTAFRPVGFGAAMNEGQWAAVMKSVSSQSFVKSDDEGSKRKLQEPEKQKLKAKEVKQMSEHNAQQNASPHQAEIVNTAPGESAPKEVNYEDFMKQLTDMQKQLEQQPGTNEELASLQKKVDDMQAEVEKKATKRALSKKMSDLQKQLQQPDGDSEEDAEACRNSGKAEAKRSGKGIVALDEIKKPLGPSYDWFSKDLLKASAQLPNIKLRTGFQQVTRMSVLFEGTTSLISDRYLITAVVDTGATVTAGQVVYISTAGLPPLVKPTDGVRKDVIGVALTGGAAGGFITVICRGLVRVTTSGTVTVGQRLTSAGSGQVAPVVAMTAPTGGSSQYYDTTTATALQAQLDKTEQWIGRALTAVTGSGVIYALLSCMPQVIEYVIYRIGFNME